MVNANAITEIDTGLQPSLATARFMLWRQARASVPVEKQAKFSFAGGETESEGLQGFASRVHHYKMLALEAQSVDF
jgi:hypothetical protein